MKIILTAIFALIEMALLPAHASADPDCSQFNGTWKGIVHDLSEEGKVEEALRELTLQVSKDCKKIRKGTKEQPGALRLVGKPYSGDLPEKIEEGFRTQKSGSTCYTWKEVGKSLWITMTQTVHRIPVDPAAGKERIYANAGVLLLTLSEDGTTITFNVKPFYGVTTYPETGETISFSANPTSDTLYRQ